MGLCGTDDERAIRSTGGTAKELYNLAFLDVVDTFESVSKTSVRHGERRTLSESHGAIGKVGILGRTQ